MLVDIGEELDAFDISQASLALAESCMDLTTRAAKFFASTVRPTVLECYASPRDVRRGRLAAIVLFHMADYWKLESPTARTIDDLKAICPDFSLVMDVANASKHRDITRGTHRKLDSEDQVNRTAGIFEAAFGQGVFNEASIVMVMLNDGTERPLLEALRSVGAMWENLLHVPVDERALDT